MACEGWFGLPFERVAVSKLHRGDSCSNKREVLEEIAELTVPGQGVTKSGGEGGEGEEEEGGGGLSAPNVLGRQAKASPTFHVW